MKELKHDLESYIITIKRSGQKSADIQTITPVIKHPGRMIHESSDHHESSALHEPQAPYSSAPAGPHASSVTEITSPLPGIIVTIKVKVGDAVREGQELAVIEAMKMENSIESPGNGTVSSINVPVGETVSEGRIIMTIDHGSQV